MSTDTESSVEIEVDGPEAEAGRKVFAWRLHQLLRAGYDEADAVALALRGDVDLHDAVDLTVHGCPPTVAAQILL